MSLRLYMDHNVQSAVTEGLRMRGVEVLTAREDGFDRRSDSELLARAAALESVVFTHDADFLAIAAQWQAQGRKFDGVIFAKQNMISVGQAITDLEVIALILTSDDVQSQLIYLPL